MTFLLRNIGGNSSVGVAPSNFSGGVKNSDDSERGEKEAR